ncbi:MAG: hypothetical protein ABJN26_22555 [Stappiaceae bacterium]
MKQFLEVIMNYRLIAALFMMLSSSISYSLADDSDLDIYEKEQSEGRAVRLSDCVRKTVTFGIVDRARGYSFDYVTDACADGVLTIDSRDRNKITNVLITSRRAAGGKATVHYDGPFKSPIIVPSGRHQIVRWDFKWSGTLDAGQGTYSW